MLDEKLTVSGEQRKVAPLLDGGKPVILRYGGKDHQMYRYKNENDMKIGRSIWLKFFESQKELKIAAGQLSGHFETMITCINGRDYAKVSAMAFMLKDWVDNLTPMRLLLEQAAVLYFDAGEDLATLDMKLQEEKVKAMEQYGAAFFLKALLIQSGMSSEDSLADILAFLKASEVKVRAYEKVLDGLAT